MSRDYVLFFFFKQKTAYEMRISDWSSDVCSSDLLNVLANELNRISDMNWQTRDYTRNGLRDALREVVARMTVYRTYVTAKGASDEDRRYIDWAVRSAKRRSGGPDLSI